MIRLALYVIVLASNPDTVDADIKISDYISSLLAKIVVSCLLAIYLENVVDDGSNLKKRPLFFLDWFKRQQPTTQTSNNENEVLTRPILSENKIQVINLSKSYGEFVALKDVNISLDCGKIHFMLGHNGAGKSTFINLLIGLQAPTSGRIFYKNQDLVKMQKEENNSLKIGICPSHDIIWDRLTVYEHLRIVCHIRKIKNRIEVIDSIVERFGLLSHLNIKASDLSGGFKRKLSIAMSLIGDSDILFLDEPTSALDPISRKDVWEVIQKFKDEQKEKIILMTTHHLEEAEKLADNIIFISEGNIKLVGTVEELKRNFGLGYSIDVIFASDPTESNITDFKAKIESDLKDIANFQEEDWVSFGSKIEIKVNRANMGKISQILKSIKNNLPAQAFITFETNTLEKAYIEIDKKLHLNRDTNEEALLNQIFDNLYGPQTGSSVLKNTLLVAKNRFSFFRTDFVESFRLVVHVIFICGCIGVLKYFFVKKDIQLYLNYLCYIFFVLAYVEINLFVNGTLNLLKDNERNIKQFFQANRISPVSYYFGKFIFDFFSHFMVSFFILGFFRLLFDAKIRENQIETEFIYCVLIFMFWKINLITFGYVHYRIFHAEKVFLSFYVLYYIAINSIWVGIYFGFTKKIRFFSETMMLYSLLDDLMQGRDFNILFALLQMFGLFVFYVFLAVTFDNYNMIINFVNKTLNLKEMANQQQEINTVEILNGNLDEMKNELAKTVKEEVTNTLQAELKSLKLIDVKKKYFMAKDFALKGATFSIDKKSNFGLVGPNGAGKSTLFNMILGKINKTSGNIEIQKTPSYSVMSTLCTLKTPYNYNNYSICFQENTLWDNLRVESHLDFYIELHQINRKALTQLLVYFEFQSFLSKTPLELSTGNKRKLCIIISLLTNPNVILFDEATAGIDINMRLRMKSIIRYFNKRNDCFSIFTTHFLKDIEIYCDRIGIIDKGEFLAITSIDRIKQILGGYQSNVTLVNFEDNQELVEKLGKLCRVKVIASHSETRQTKAHLDNISNLFDLIETFLALKNQNLIEEFSLNQLSIEDIYLDIFNQ